MTSIMTRFLARLVGALAIASAAALAPAMLAPANAIEIDITEGTLDPLPIAIASFEGDPVLAPQMRGVIEANLRRSGLFRPLEPTSFLQADASVAAQPRHADWRAIGAQALLLTRVTQNPDGSIGAEFRLWDPFTQAQLTGRQLATSGGNWRRLAHQISDAVYTQLTGETGYFDTRIVFIDEAGPKTARIKRLAIMDQDGANLRYLSQGDELVLTPRFSPVAQSVVHMSYAGGQPQVVLLDLNTGQRQALGNFPGMTFAPRFSPDGGSVVMSLEQGGNSDIYSMNLATRQLVRLTSTPAIETAPSYSPDGQRIVFESDRDGQQQLYVMNADGSAQVRISNGGGRYATPVWSPRGDLIAFTKQEGGRFKIGVMRPDGTGERIITEGYHNEGPTWSPNGRVLMFFRETRGEAGGPQLWSVDLTGYNEAIVPTPAFGSDPAWGPLLN